jgi:hypothetical protein
LISYLIEAVRYLAGRPSLRVRVIQDRDSEEVGSLRFELENVGSRPTSLHPLILVSYWLPIRGHFKRQTATFAVREIDRELPPFRAKVFSASSEGLHANYGFSWFRTFTVRTTTGHWTRVHVRHALLDPLSAPRFYWELGRFRALGRLPRSASSMNIDEFEAQRRRHGPH